MLLQSKYLDIHFPHDALDIQNIPVLTRFLTVTYLIFSAALWAVRRRVMIEDGADASLIICPLMQLVPGMVLRYPISIFASNLVDTEFWKFIVDLLNLVIGGSYIERCWNSPGELFRYLLVVGSCINIAACVAVYIASMFSSSVRLDLAIDGNYTMLIGFAIAYKQLIPETTIFHLKNIPIISKNFRFKMLPIFIMCFLTAVEVLWYHRFIRLLTIWSTFFGCWTYLRFYQIIPSAITGTVTSDLVVGDASETFQLIYFFPDLLKPVLRPIFDYVYKTVIGRLHLRRPFGAHDIEVGNMVGVSRVMSADVEVRRKQLAMEVLEQHISSEHEEKVTV